MYLHIGQNEILPDRRVIGIFDLDKCSYGKRTREYLAAAEKEGVVLDVSGEIPKSFVVCDHPYHRQIVYLSQLNSTTLQKRAESGNLERVRRRSPWRHIRHWSTFPTFYPRSHPWRQELWCSFWRQCSRCS